METSEMLDEAVSTGMAVVETINPPINPLIGIDSDLSWAVAILAFVYVGFLCFFPTKRRAQIGICLGIAALSFSRIGLGVEIFSPIFVGCIWLFNAIMSFFGMRTLERIQNRIAVLQSQIEQAKIEQAKIKNRTYTVWPPNPE